VTQTELADTEICVGDMLNL